MSKRACRALFAALVCLGLLVATTGTAAGDEPVRGNIVVPVERVEPGATFPVTGYQLDPDVVITLTLRQGDRSAAIGHATVGLDGMLASDGVVPPNFEPGYSELVAVSSGGGQWVVSVLIGGSEAPGDATAPFDPRVLALAVLAIGLVIVLGAGWRYLRR